MSGYIVNPGDILLVTGATGFIGARVVAHLALLGFTSIRCLCRPSGDVAALLAEVTKLNAAVKIDVFEGNLSSLTDCEKATEGVSIVYHLAVGAGSKSFPDMFMNSVVTTRNLLEGCRKHGTIKRFVNVSSFSVYSNLARATVLTETSAVDDPLYARCEAYCYAKAKQDKLVETYSLKYGVPQVTMRPGVVYGPGKNGIVGRVGLGTFGVFLHLGGSNHLPVTYVDNCAEAIALAGLVPGIDGEIFNIVDDDLPTSRQVLRRYKREVENFRSIYLPRPLSYLLFAGWEKYAKWSKGQLPLTFNKRVWHAYWKGARYSNAKLKQRLNWRPRISTKEGLDRYFEACRRVED